MLSLDSLRRKWRQLDLERTRCVVEAGRLEHEADKLRQQQEQVEAEIRERGRPTPARCSIPGCPSSAHTRGLCGTHYQRQRRGAHLTAPVVAKLRLVGVERHRPLVRTPRAELQREVLPSNPRRLGATIPKAAQGRRTECPAYADCLDYAASRNWQGFTCAWCAGEGESHG